tara:strand:+ start:34 stop:768 length:735 start_codon:yes stop_codon:yes gene_type:complete
MKKSKTRIFVNKSISLNLMIYIKDKQHHFLKNVLRVKINDNVNIFDGLSGEWKTEVVSVNRNNTVLKVIKNIRKMRKSPDVWLIFAPVKQHRMYLSIQRATELGVSRIIPCLTEFTNMRINNIKNLQDNAIESAEQSDRLDIPKIEKQNSLESILSNLPIDRQILYCNERIRNDVNVFKKLSNLSKQNEKWAVLIGPEGGFSDKENDLICSQDNTVSVSLGDKVLRSDTAITISLFCIMQLLST